LEALYGHYEKTFALWQDAKVPAGRKLEQRFGRLGRQVIGERQQRVLVGLANVGQPFRGHAIAEQRVVGQSIEQLLACCSGLRGLDVGRDDDLAHGLPYLDKLRGAGLRVGLQLTSLGPAIRLVVMVDVAQQQAARGSVDDQANVAADAHRPEIPVLRLIEFVKAETRIGRIELEVERGGLNGLLLVACETGEAVREGVRDAELHRLRASSV